ADFTSLPNHPITRGVKPFKIRDEWYYNIRFRPEMKGVTSILVGRPDDETRQGKSSSPRGPYPHVVAASGREEVVAWAVERLDGERGSSAWRTAVGPLTNWRRKSRSRTSRWSFGTGN